MARRFGRVLSSWFWQLVARLCGEALRLPVNQRPEAISILQRLAEWFKDHNTFRPHSGLCLRSPREYIANPSGTQATYPF